MRHATGLLLVLTGLVTGALWFNHHSAEGDSPPPRNGSYTVEMNVISGEGHQTYIQMPHSIKLTLNLTYDLGTPHYAFGRFSGPPPFVTVYADSRPLIDYFEKQSSGWEFVMSGRGTVAGHPDVLVTFSGHFEDNGAVSGVYTMGANNELPGGYAIEYQVKNSTFATYTPASTVTPSSTATPTYNFCVIAGSSAGGASCTPTATPPAQQETVAQFLQLFNTAIQTGDASFLLGRLNPHVIEVYGEANCAATVAAMTDPTSSFTINSTSGPASWTWSEPGTSILIDNVYTVSVKRVVEGTSSVQDIHLAVVQGRLTWFRSCPPAGTPTATGTPGSCKTAGGSCPPTDTPTPAAMPPTATRTPSNTATPAPGNGDCNHDGVANAIDALLSLQSGAGLLPSPGACADVNRDGVVNALDAALVLQYSAGLIGHLPWP